MRRGSQPLPPDIESRLATLGGVLEQHPAVRFAYLFGGAGRGELRPLSDVDVAALNGAPTALVGRILQSRRVITDKDPFLRHRFESVEIRKFLDFRLFEQRHLDARFARA